MGQVNLSLTAEHAALPDMGRRETENADPLSNPLYRNFADSLVSCTPVRRCEKTMGVDLSHANHTASTS